MTGRERSVGRSVGGGVAGMRAALATVGRSRARIDYAAAMSSLAVLSALSPRLVSAHTDVAGSNV